MKLPMVMAVALSLCLGSVFNARADDKKPGAPTPPKVKRVAKPSKGQAVTTLKPKMLITGSRIETSVEADGRIPVTSSPLCVITATDIQRLGASDLAQVLRRSTAGLR